MERCAHLPQPVGRDMCLVQLDRASLRQGIVGAPREAVIQCPATPKRVSMPMDVLNVQSPGLPKGEGCSDTSLFDQFQTPDAVLINPRQKDNMGFGVQRSKLSSALQAGSIDKVRDILRDDPDAAWMPQDGLEGGLALSEAIARECDITIIDYLIAHGADPSMPDSRGRTSLIMLATRPPLTVPCDRSWMDIATLTGFVPTNTYETLESSVGQKKIDWLLNVAECLMKAGCNPMECNAKGKAPEQLAHEHGLEALAAFIRSWQDFKMCLILHRSMQKANAATASKSLGLAQLHCSLFCVHLQIRVRTPVFQIGLPGCMAAVH